jgi:hypothetical protein
MLAMTYRDIPVEAKLPDGPYDPRDSLIPSKPRGWKFLTEMTYQELIDMQDKKRQRVRV